MASPNETIHQTVRLKIMAALNAGGEPLEFARLKTVTAASDGNLGAHLTTLEQAGYVIILKDFVGKRPRTRARLTPEGRRAFAEHVAYLREILESGSGVSAD